ncbi:MAG: ABC transporter [Leptothrix sp. (in: Bacteria)]|nr:ABC transporter [Leptothrix sp. (in: b-proteobacteria)]
MNPCLEAQDVRVQLGGRNVLHRVSTQIATGWTAIVGPNGAGKSTLLRALAGLQPLAGGQVRIQGQGLGQALDAMPAPERARRIAWLAQGGETSGDLSVRETVELGRIAQHGQLRTLSRHDTEVVAQAMRATECSAWAARRLTDLSGGERQRVLLARVLATEAPVLLLDEPTTHLDAPHQVALTRLFRRLAQPLADGTQRAVVTVLHDLPIALRADRVLVMQAGCVVAAASPASPDLHRALERVFQGAVRVSPVPGGAIVALALDD